MGRSLVSSRCSGQHRRPGHRRISNACQEWTAQGREGLSRDSSIIWEFERLFPAELGHAPSNDNSWPVYDQIS